MEIKKESKARLFEIAYELISIAEENGLHCISLMGGTYIHEGEKRNLTSVYIHPEEGKCMSLEEEEE